MKILNSKNCEVDYRVETNPDKQQVELIRWMNEDKVILKLGYHKGSNLTYKEAKQLVMNCLAAIGG